jgi:hypothetical protein
MGRGGQPLDRLASAADTVPALGDSTVGAGAGKVALPGAVSSDPSVGGAALALRGIGAQAGSDNLRSQDASDEIGGGDRVGPVSARGALVTALRSLTDGSTPATLRSIQLHLCETLVTLLRCDSPRNHAGMLQLLLTLTSVVESDEARAFVQAERLRTKEPALSLVDFRAFAHSEVHAKGGVQVLMELCATTSVYTVTLRSTPDVVAGAERVAIVLARGPSETISQQMVDTLREAGVVEKMVKVVRGPEDHMFRDAARKQAHVLLDLLGVDRPAIERETIRQELVEVQDVMESTILKLSEEPSYEKRKQAALWVRDFVFSHGSQSQYTALSKGIVPMVTACCRQHGPGSHADHSQQLDAVEVFGSLLLTLLQPELPKDNSRFAFATAESLFAEGQMFEASLEFTQALHAHHPDMCLCYQRRAACYTALGRGDDAKQDLVDAEVELKALSYRTEQVVEELLGLRTDHEPRLPVYIGVALAYVFPGLSQASDAVVRSAFAPIISLCEMACSKRYPDINVLITPDRPVRWQRASISASYTAALQQIVRLRLTDTVLPHLSAHSRYFLYTSILLSMQLQHEIKGSLQPHDTDVALWAFYVLSNNANDAEPRRAGPTLRLEDRTDAVDVYAASGSEIQLADGSLEAHKYLKVDCLKATGWILDHPTCLQPDSLPDLIAAFAPLLVLVTIGSPHMQQITLRDTHVCEALFQGIMAKETAYWGSSDSLIALLEDMMRSPLPKVRKALIDAGMLDGLEGLLSYPHLANESVELLSKLMFTAVQTDETLGVVIALATEYPLRGILTRVGSSTDPDTQYRCLMTLENLVGADTSAVANACEPAVRSLVVTYTEREGGRSSSTSLRNRASVLLQKIEAYFDAAIAQLKASTKDGDLRKVFEHLCCPARHIRVGAISILISAARAITGDVSLIAPKPPRPPTLPSRQVHVTVFECRNLKKMDLVGRNDVYVLSHMAQGSQRTTTVVDGGSSPVWVGGGETLVLGDSNTAPEQIRVEVWDEDRHSADDLIGSVVLPIDPSKLRPRVDFEQPAQWLKLTNSRDKEVGQVLVSFRWKIPEPLKKLRATILACRNLPKVDRFGQNDVYVIFDAGGDRQQSSTVSDGGANPVWVDADQTVPFERPSRPCAVTVEVFDEDSIGADDLIGSCVVHIDEQCGHDSQWSMPSRWFELKNSRDKVVGEVHVELRWVAPDPDAAGWTLTVAGAQGLPRADGIGAKSDPYAVVLWNGVMVGQTQHEVQTLEPCWNQQFVLHASTNKDDTLKIQVFDYDKLSTDDFLGEVSVPVGESSVRHIQATIIACRGLKKMDVFGKNDVYVVLEVDGQTRQSSTVSDGGAAPTWLDGEGETVSFECTTLPSEVYLHVYDEDLLSADDLIGSYTIRLVEDPSFARGVDWTMPATWVQLTDSKGKSMGELHISLQWAPLVNLPDRLPFVRTLIGESGKSAGKLELQLARIAEMAPVPTPKDPITRAAEQCEVEDSKYVHLEDYVVSVDLVSALCRLAYMRSSERQRLYIQLLASIKKLVESECGLEPVSRGRLVDAMVSGSHSLIMTSDVEEIKMEVFDQFWRHNYIDMIQKATDPDDSRRCLASIAEFITDDSDKQLATLSRWVVEQHTQMSHGQTAMSSVDSVIEHVLLHFAQTARGREALIRVVDVPILLHLLDAVPANSWCVTTNHILDENIVAAVQLWAVSGIPVLLTDRAERETFIQHHGIDTLLPLVDFEAAAAAHWTKRDSLLETGTQVARILWSCANLLEDAQFEHIVYGMCTQEGARRVVDTSHARPLLRILRLDPNGVREPLVTSWAVDCLYSLVTLESREQRDVIARQHGYALLERVAIGARAESVACTAVRIVSICLHQQLRLNAMSTLLWYIDATGVATLAPVRPVLDATVVELLMRQAWAPAFVLDKDHSRHHVLLAACAVLRYTRQPPGHASRRDRQRWHEPKAAGAWGAEHGEAGVVGWAEQLPVFFPLLHYVFFAAVVAPPLAGLLLLPLLTSDKRAQKQNVFCLLASFLGIQTLSLVIFMMWVTRDLNYRAACRISKPQWRTEVWDWGALSRLVRRAVRRWRGLRRSVRNSSLLRRHGGGRPDFVVPQASSATEPAGDAPPSSSALRYLLDAAPEPPVSAVALANASSTSSSAQIKPGCSKRLMAVMQRLGARCLRGTALGPAAWELVYLCADFLQLNGFCFLNHGCWRDAAFLPQLLARVCAASHLQLHSSLQLTGSAFAWTMALLAVILYVLGSEVLLVSVHVKICKVRHRLFSCCSTSGSEPAERGSAADDDDVAQEPRGALARPQLALEGQPELAAFAVDVGLPLHPAHTPTSSDVLRAVRHARRALRWLLSHRELLLLLGTVGFTPIASQLLVALSCAYPENHGRPDVPPARSLLLGDSGVCWDTEHRYFVAGTLAAMGAFVPLVVLVGPVLLSSCRAAAFPPAVTSQPDGAAAPKQKLAPAPAGLEAKGSSVATTPMAAAAAETVTAVQWSPVYSGARALSKMVLVLLPVLLPGEGVGLLLDLGVLASSLGFAAAAVLSQPCNVHAVLKIHVVVLACASCTAGVSLYFRLHREPSTTQGGTCAETSVAFLWLLLLWAALFGLSLSFRLWWSVISGAADIIATWRENQRRNAAVLKLEDDDVEP